MIYARACDLRRGDRVLLRPHERRSARSVQYTVWAVHEDETGVSVRETDVYRKRVPRVYRYGPREWVWVG